MSFNPNETGIETDPVGESITAPEDEFEQIQQQERREEEIRERIAEQAGEGFTGEDVDIVQQNGVTQGVLNTGALERELSEDILSTTDRFDRGDVTFTETDEGLEAGISEDARRREAAEEFSASAGIDVTTEDVELTEDGPQLTEAAQERTALEDLQGETAIELTGEDLVLQDGAYTLSEAAQEQERQTDIQQAIQDAAQESDLYGTGDFEVITEDGEQQIVPTESAVDRERQEIRTETIEQLLAEPLAEDSGQTLGDVFGQEDIAFEQTEGGQAATIEDAAIEEYQTQQRQAQREEAAQEFERFSVSDLEIEGEQIVPTEDAVSRERQEQLEQVASDSDRFSVADLEVADGEIQPTEDALSRERDEIRADTFAQLQEETETDLSQEDIEFTDSGVELSAEVRRQEALDDLQGQTDIELETADIALTGSGASITEQAQREEAAQEFGVDPWDIEIEGGQATVSEFAQEQQAAQDLTNQIRNQISQDVFGEIGSGPSQLDLGTGDIERTEGGFTLSESGQEAVEEAQLDTVIGKIDEQFPYQQIGRDDVSVTEEGVQPTQETQLEAVNMFGEEYTMDEVRFTDEGIQLSQSEQVERFEEEIGQNITEDQARFDFNQLDVEETQRAIVASQFEEEIRSQGLDISGVSASDVERQDGEFVIGTAVEEQITDAQAERLGEGFEVQGDQVVATTEAAREQVTQRQFEDIAADTPGVDASDLELSGGEVTLTAQAQREQAAEQFQSQVDTDIDIPSRAVELTEDGATLAEGVQTALNLEQQADFRQEQLALQDDRVAEQLTEETGIDVPAEAVNIEGGEVQLEENIQRGIQAQRRVDASQRQIERQETLESLAETPGVDVADEIGAGTALSQRLAQEEQIEESILAETDLEADQLEVARGETFITDPGLRRQIELQNQVGQLQDTQGVDVGTEFGSGTIGGLGPASERIETVQEDVSADLEGVDAQDVSVTQSPTGLRVSATQTTTEETDTQPLGGDIASDAVSFAEDTTGLDAPGDGAVMVPTESAVIDEVTGGLADQVSGSDLRGGVEDVTGVDVPTQEDISGGIDAFVEEPIEDATGVNIPSAEQFNRGVDRAAANVVSGLQGAIPSRRETAALATTAVAVPEPASTGTGALILGGLTATAGAATLADEYNLVSLSPRTVQEEEEIPVAIPQGQSELPVSEQLSRSELTPTERDVSELSVPETDQTSELEPGEADVTELPIEPGEGTGEIPIRAQAQELIQRERQEQEQREITDEDIIGDLPEIDQPGPSIREQQRRDDLFVPQREFPTGEQAVVDRETITEETTERIEEVQESDLVTEQGIPQTPEETVPLAEGVERDTLTQAQQQRLETAQDTQLFSDGIEVGDVTQQEAQRLEEAQAPRVDVSTGEIQAQTQEFGQRTRTLQDPFQDVTTEPVQDLRQTPTPTQTQDTILQQQVEQIPRVTGETQLQTPTEYPPETPTITELRFPEGQGYPPGISTPPEQPPRPPRPPTLPRGTRDNGFEQRIGTAEEGILTDFVNPLTGERIETDEDARLFE